MKFLSLFRKKHKPLDEHVCTHVYDIPLDLTVKILQYKKHGDNFWDNMADPMTDEDYHNMLLGASIAYHNQNIMGKALPNNDVRAVELCRYMLSQGLAIQYHPEHGMQIVDITDDLKYIETHKTITK